MHTLKLAVIDLSELKGRQFGIDEFRQVIHSRLYKLDPFRYELVDIPFKFHHPMWRAQLIVGPASPHRPSPAGRPRGPRPTAPAGCPVRHPAPGSGKPP